MALEQQDAETEGMRHQIIVAGAVGISIAAFTTILRLGLRVRRLWWDDALAFAGLIFLVTTGVAGKIYYSINDTSKIPQSSRVALYYIFAVTFDLTIWTSRVSVLLNITRLGYYKRRLCGAAALFVLALAILVAQIFWVCEPQNKQTGWKSTIVPQCVLGKSVAIVQVTTDAFADAVLVAVPLMLLRDLNTSDAMAHRVRLTASFAIGGLTTVVSIVHAYYLWQDTQVSVIVSNVELSVSVIVCNFVVLSAATHRLWDRYRTRKMHLAQRSTHMDFESPTTTATQIVGTGRTARLDPFPDISMDEADFGYRTLDAACSHYKHSDIDRVKGCNASFTADKLHSKDIITTHSTRDYSTSV